MMTGPLPGVSSISLLSLLQRHQGASIGIRQMNPIDMRTVASELDAAQTVAEKLRILERLLRQEQPGEPALSASASSAGSADDAPAQAWKVSDKSTALMNELSYQQYGRRWEADAVIKAVIDQVHHMKAEEGIPHIAMPFKPSAADMEKAIEALGYSPRSLLGQDEMVRLREIGTMEAGGGLARMAIIVLVSILIGILLFAM